MSAAVEIPTILVVLGATGDLIQKKIIPSICHLYANQRLPGRFRVVGMARRTITEKDFQAYVRNELKIRMPHTPQKTAEEAAALFTYHQGKFDDQDAFERLKLTLEKIDIDWGLCSNKLFYLAVPPAHFETIFKNLARVRLNLPCGGRLGWTRLLIEKPFGEDSKSAKKMLGLLDQFFKEEQIYLIDHYLAKEIVQAISHFRFSNNLFEKSWARNSIEKIDIRLLETIGVEERGAFYDTVGAFRDVGENHLLQMLAALTMDVSRDMSAENIRRKRADIFEQLKRWQPGEIKKHSFRAQHEGYRSIPNVKTDSETETYFKLRTELTHPDWRGVPITLEAGKCFPKAIKEAVVTFRHPDFCKTSFSDQPIHNRVVFSIEPEDKIDIHFWTKKPGFEQELEERTFSFFLYEHVQEIPYVEEYANLIFKCLIGDQTFFVSRREVLAQWRFADPVISAWRKNAVPLRTYAPGSDAILQQAHQIDPKHPANPIPKEMAIVGLGKMGASMARRMMDKGWRVVGYNRSPEVTEALAKEGLVKAASLEDMVKKLPEPKVIWLMVPAGKPVDEILFGAAGLVQYLKKGDFVIDGGNSFYKDTIARAEKLKKFGIRFLDSGTSGGPGGARRGACLMIGGKREDFEMTEALFRDFALPEGYQFFKGSGAGHFVKMVHNGIEYGMMQAIAEGFTILKKANFKLDLTRVSDIYNHGSVIEARLIGWLKDAFELYGEDLKPISGSAQQSGEGLWTVKTASELGVKSKVLREAVLFRRRSEKHPDFTGQIVSALRGQFGGHPVFKKNVSKKTRRI